MNLSTTINFGMKTLNATELTTLKITKDVNFLEVKLFLIKSLSNYSVPPLSL